MGEFLSSLFKNVSFSDLLKGAGAVATGYGALKNGKDQMAFMNKQFDYMKSRDERADNIQDANQENLDNAVNNVFGKKKTNSNLPTIDSGYGTTQVV